ncbi:MAG: hypothetical protein LBH54_00410 [Clostridiales bacterium]|nr:hypothetical protein [Clostridiales bacterium]
MPKKHIYIYAELIAPLETGKRARFKPQRGRVVRTERVKKIIREGFPCVEFETRDRSYHLFPRFAPAMQMCALCA